MIRPSTVHWYALKRIIQYLKGTLDFFFYKYLSFHLHAFVDIGWVSNIDNRISTLVYIIFFGVI